MNFSKLNKILNLKTEEIKLKILTNFTSNEADEHELLE